MARSFEASQAEFEEIKIPVDERAWLELRKPWWNASLAACLFDEHPYVTMGDACTEKLREDFVVVDEDTAKLYRRGLAMEPYIAAEAAELMGVKLRRPTHMARRGVMLCTPDYEIVDRDDEGVEVKSTRQYVRGQVLRYWWHQGQGQCWCKDWARVHFAVLDATLDVQIFTIERDDDYLHRLMERATAAIECLEWGELPPGVQLSADNVSVLWPKDSGEEAEVGADVVPLLAEYLEAHANYKGWEKEKARLRDRCVAELGPDSIATVDGVPVFTYQASKDVERVDWKRMIAENPEIAKKYTAPKAGPRTFRPNAKGIATMTRRMDGSEEFG